MASIPLFWSMMVAVAPPCWMSGCPQSCSRGLKTQRERRMLLLRISSWKKQVPQKEKPSSLVLSPKSRKARLNCMYPFMTLCFNSFSSLWWQRQEWTAWQSESDSPWWSLFPQQVTPPQAAAAPAKSPTINLPICYQYIMFSDVRSVRSQPTRNSRGRRPAPQIELDPPSQLSRQRPSLHWRTAIHPEIHAAYDLLCNGQTLHWGREGREAREAREAREGRAVREGRDGKQEKQDSEKSSGSGHNDCEEKIKGLQEQNSSLREELYYLREALLINFQNKHS